MVGFRVSKFQIQRFPDSGRPGDSGWGSENDPKPTLGVKLLRAASCPQRSFTSGWNLIDRIYPDAPPALDSAFTMNRMESIYVYRWHGKERLHGWLYLGQFIPGSGLLG
jgi:hypothetical protein